MHLNLYKSVAVVFC